MFFGNDRDETKRKGNIFGRDNSRSRSSFGGFQKASDLNKSGFFGSGKKSPKKSGKFKSTKTKKGNSFFGAGDSNSPKNNGNFFGRNSRSNTPRFNRNSPRKDTRDKGGFFRDSNDKKFSPIRNNRSPFSNDDRGGSMFNRRDGGRENKKIVSSFLKNYKEHSMRHPSENNRNEKIYVNNIILDDDYKKYIHDVRILRLNDYCEILKYSGDGKIHTKAGKELYRRLHSGLGSLDSEIMKEINGNEGGRRSNRETGGVMFRRRDRDDSREKRGGFGEDRNDQKRRSGSRGGGGGFFGGDSKKDGFFGGEGRDDRRREDSPKRDLFGRRNSRESKRDRGGGFFGNNGNDDNRRFGSPRRKKSVDLFAEINHDRRDDRGGNMFKGNSSNQRPDPQNNRGGYSRQPLQSGEISFIDTTLGILQQTLIQQTKILESMNQQKENRNKNNQDNQEDSHRQQLMKMKHNYSTSFQGPFTYSNPFEEEMSRGEKNWKNINTPINLQYSFENNLRNTFKRRKPTFSNIPKIKKNPISRRTSHNNPRRKIERKVEENNIFNPKFAKITVITEAEEKVINISLKSKDLSRYSVLNFKKDILEHIYPEQELLHKDLIMISHIYVEKRKMKAFTLLRKYLKQERNGFTEFEIKVPSDIRVEDYGLSDNPMMNISILRKKAEEDLLQKEMKNLGFSEVENDKDCCYKDGFEISPNLHKLVQENGLPALKSVENFSMANDFGGIYFLEPVDISLINKLSDYVKITENFIEVFPEPEFSFKPGIGINKACFLIYDNLWDGKMKKGKFLKKLGKLAKKIGGEVDLDVFLEDETVKIIMPFLRPN